MSMPWFKFYGQDFMTDPKIKRLNPIQQLMWVYLLCLAGNSKDGTIEYINVKDLILLCGISPLENVSLLDLTKDFFAQLVKMKMIEIKEEKVLIVNYLKRQESNLTDAERAKRYRDKQKNIPAQRDERHIVQRDDSNARLDKIRIDKNNINNILVQKAPAIEIPPKRKCSNPKGHGDCIESINSIQDSFKKQFPNYGKQVKAYHQIIKAGYNPVQVGECLNAMDNDKFWSSNGWDLMDVANQLGKGGGKYVKLQ